MGFILFIHGMGHDPRQDYWRDWAGPLRAALEQKGMAAAGDDFDGVYYYDLVPGPAAEGCPAGFPARRRRFLAELRDFARRELQAAAEGTDFQARGLIGKLVSYLVDNFGDIFAYLYLDPVYRAVNERVYAKLRAADRPVYLLGYSLGAMVGYCALQAEPALAGRVAHLIMLGCPLFWFTRGVARRADLGMRPAVGRWTNLAGIVDIAWPHQVPCLVQGLDEHVEFIIDRFNPVRGHLAYFTNPESLAIIAGLIAETGAGS
ncbi:MAG: hypothetical protein K6U04_00240 [Armatimonadetes bacterium]|nr:hypothetical protein [Armatimonadota bacterium]